MAVRIEFDNRSVTSLIETLSRVRGEEAHRVIGRASKRAAIAARTAATKRIRAIYTIKARDLKARAKIMQKHSYTVLHIEGAMESVTKYKAKAKKGKGVFVAIKKGKGSTVPRSFEYAGRFMQREGQSRLPIRGLYGPAVPQLFGNPAVIQAMEERGLEVFEQRLLHEFGRLLGGL